MGVAVVPDRLVWLDIEDAMADAAGFVNLGHAQLVDVMVGALQHRVCSGGGFVSPAHWLTVHAGVSTAHANEIIGIAEQAHQFPHVMALLRAGKLSLDQTAAAMTADPLADRRVAEFAELATVQQIRKFVRTVAARPEPATPSDNAGDHTPGDHTPGAPAPSDTDQVDGAPHSCDTDSIHTSSEQGGHHEDHPGGEIHSDETDPGGSAGAHPAGGAEAAAGTSDSARTSRRHSRSSATVSFGFDEWSRFRLNANNLTTDQGMLLDAALNEARDYLFRHGHPNVTWADALIEICRRSLSTSGTQRAERFKTYIHINSPTRTNTTATSTTPRHPGPPGQHNPTPDEANTNPSVGVSYVTSGSDGPATITTDRRSDVSFEAILTNGIPIAPSICDYLTCDTLIQIIWQHGHLPIGVGNTTRTPPNRLRRLLELRDQGCAIPGCTSTLGLQAHHIKPWQAGGKTELHNLVLVCDAHHHQHHAGDITIAGNPQLPLGQPGALVVTDQHGRTLRTHPTPRPPHPDGRPANPNYKHPSGETCDYRYLTWKPPPAA